MLLSRRSCCDRDLFIAKEFSDGSPNNLLVKVRAYGFAVAIYVDEKLFKLEKEIVLEVFEGVNKCMTSAFIHEEEGVKRTTDGAGRTESNVAVIKITCFGRKW